MKMIFQQGQQVRHERFGLGTIELLRENTALIRFESSFEERPLSELEPVRSAQDALAEGNYDDLREVLARSQALAIRSINDSWGCSPLHVSTCCRISYGYVTACYGNGRYKS